MGLKLLLLLLIPLNLSAQSIKIINKNPNCNPFQQKFDPVWIHGEGWTMPRVGWHIMYPALSIAMDGTLVKMGVNKKVAVVASSLSLGLLPHLRQARLGLRHNGTYELNLADWVFDLWNRSLPSWNYAHSKKAYLIYLGGDLALSCWADP